MHEPAVLSPPDRDSHPRRGGDVMHRRVIAVFAVLAGLVPAVARAQIAVSANDNKVRLENGTVKVLPSPPADTVSIIDLKASPPRVVAEVQAPVSVVGPPLSVAL